MSAKISYSKDITKIENHPDVRWSARNVSVVFEEYQLTIYYGQETFKLKIPKGFEADGSSISSLSAIIGINADGRNRPAWLVHDYLYETKLVSRKITDKIFFQMLRDLNMGYARANAAYFAARIGGGFWY